MLTLRETMRLVGKFTLVFLIVFGIGFGVAAYLAHGFLQKNATDEVIQNAQLMMQTAVAMRDYTTRQIKPLLIADRSDTAFHPQTVPAYAATESFNYLR